MRYGIAIAVAIGVILVPPIAGAQAPPGIDRTVSSSLMFDVASVKPNDLGPESELWSFRRGRFTARHVTLNALIRSAYGRPERPLTGFQVVGGPAWVAFDRFDILATAPDTPESSRGTFDATVLAMLRNLLEERFQLKAHVETKEYPLFALVLARPDGRFGPGLRRRTDPCTPAIVGDRGEASAASLPGRRACGGRTAPGMLTANGATMANLTTALSLIPGVDRIVVDRTGLAGTFDIDLRWASEPAPARTQGAMPAPPVASTAPVLFTALREQLGLELERTSGRVDVLVIDRVTQPTPN